MVGPYSVSKILNLDPFICIKIYRHKHIVLNGEEERKRVCVCVCDCILFVCVLFVL